MDLPTFLWVLARVSGLASFASLSVALLSGLALRTAVLDWVGTNRSLRSVHEYTTVLWMPLGALHIASLVLDDTARIRLLDLLVPFLAPVAVYGLRGTVAIGLGTLTLELFALVAITGWLKRRMSTGVWQWIHRLSYVAFGMLFLHALLGGSDFSDPLISALTWSVALLLAVLSLARALFGRLPA
jgi:methionine sulfoxide reductase heme-binding subunit